MHTYCSECWLSRQETQRLLDEPNVFVLSGPATVITTVATASAFLADRWSTESVSRVVRTARTRQENREKERAEHETNEDNDITAGIFVNGASPNHKASDRDSVHVRFEESPLDDNLGMETPISYEMARQESTLIVTDSLSPVHVCNRSCDLFFAAFSHCSFSRKMSDCSVWSRVLCHVA